MPVNQRARSIEAREDQWRTCRDVFAGDDAVKDAAGLYLPPLAGQTADDAGYIAYKDRALFFNAYSRTVDSLRGLVFRRPLSIDVPGDIKPWLTDITLTGQSLHAFAEEAFDDQLVISWGGIWVDHTRPQGMPQSRAEERNMAHRPYMRWYPAESILEVAVENAFGAHRVVRVRLYEVEEQAAPDDEFGTEMVEQWRVLELVDGRYQQRVFRNREHEENGQTVVTQVEVTEEPIVPLRNGQPLDYIPFHPFGNRGFATTPPKPVLIDLARTNLSHYRTMADIENARHMTGFPMPVLAYNSGGSGMDSLELGTQQGFLIPDNQAKWGYLSYGGEGLKGLENAAAQKEMMMAMQGARMLLPEKLAAEAHATVQLRRYGETSVLGAAAIALEEALTWAVGEMVLWAGGTSEIRIGVNRDFDPTMMEPTMLREMRETWKIGGISMEMWLDMLKRGELVDPRITIEEFQAQQIQGINDPETRARMIAALQNAFPEMDARAAERWIGLPEGVLGEKEPPPLLTDETGDGEEGEEEVEELEAAE